MNDPASTVEIDVREAADAIAARYPAVPGHATDAAVAVLALWVIDAIETGRLSRADATDVFMRLWVRVTDAPAAPTLSDDVHELLVEVGWLHAEPIGHAPDLAELRRLAFGVLRAQAA